MKGLKIDWLHVHVYSSWGQSTKKSPLPLLNKSQNPCTCPYFDIVKQKFSYLNSCIFWHPQNSWASLHETCYIKTLKIASFFRQGLRSLFEFECNGKKKRTQLTSTSQPWTQNVIRKDSLHLYSKHGKCGRVQRWKVF